MVFRPGVVRRAASVLGRRQFVAAAGVTVAAALGPKAWAAETSVSSGALVDWRKVKGLEGLEAAFEFLQKMKIDEGAIGDTPIEGQDVFVKVQKITTKPVAGSRVEVHRRYIDVHYLVKGQESIGFVPGVEGLEVLQPFDAAKDIGFFARPAEAAILPVREGRFAVFFPGQGHAPGLDLEGSHTVLKAVVKISAEWRARHLPR